MVINLVTGGGGFVASHLIELLLSKGETVYATVKWNEDLSKIEHIKDKIKFEVMDLTDFISVLKVIEKVKPDYIYHLAAESFVPESYRRPQSYMMANGIGTLNLLEAVKYVRENDYFHNFDPIIHVCSSSEVYGLVEENELPINENQPFRPGNWYGVSKIAADMYGWLYYKNYGLKVIRTRFFTHTGPRRTMLSVEVNFAKQIAMIENGLQEPVLKHGNLNSTRTFADVRDAVKGYYLLSRKGKAGEVYNIAGNNVRTIKELLDYLLSLSPMKGKIKTELDPSLLRPVDVNMQIVDTTKFKKDTNWEPEITFEQTMQDILNYWRAKVK